VGISKKRSILSVFGICSVLFFCVHDSHGSTGITYAGTIAEGRAAATEAMTTTGASSISLAFVEKDQVVWAEAFGLAEKETGTPPTVNTMYNIGSTSKTLAAIAIMRLVDEKMVALDAPVTRYIKSFTMASPKYRQVTVRHLLNHSSGFPGSDYRNIFTLSPVSGYSAQALETVRNSRLKHNPGYLNVYCNDGYTLLEEIISSVTGKTYPQFVTDEILAPLGMEHSRYPLDYFPDGSFAQRYSGDTRLPQLFVNGFATGGLYSTPTDMARIAMMLMGRGKTGNTRILSPAAVAAMGVDQTTGRFNPTKNYGFSYGLGFDSVRQPGLRAVGVVGWVKGGDAVLYSGTMVVAPAERLAAVVLGASGSFSSVSATLIAERILLRALVEKRRIRAMPKLLDPKPLPLRKPSAALLASIGGHYAHKVLYRMDPQPDGSLTAYKWNKAAGEWALLATGLKFRSDGSFRTDSDPGSAFSFLTAQGRRYLNTRSIQGFHHYQDNLLLGQKITPAKDFPEAWANRANREWLLTNEYSDGNGWSVPMLRLKVIDNILFAEAGDNSQVPDPSYSDSVGGMMLLIPQLNGRDLNDLVIETREGNEWIRLGSTLYRPKSTVSALEPGTIEIGAEGLAEWRTITLDAGGTISVASNGSWRVFTNDVVQSDSVDGEKSITLSAGTYYLLFHSNATVNVARQ
jgi:CubicO group peptidase (beta-lactamase class C family)